MFALFETLRQDVRYAARSLRRSPGFVTVVVLSLALGIAANSTMLRVINAELYRPLPYDQPGSLMVIWETDEAQPNSTEGPPIAELVDWNIQNHVFEDIALTSDTEAAPMARIGEPELIRQQSVTPNFFSVLRVKPALGRVFSKHDQRGYLFHHGTPGPRARSTTRNCIYRGQPGILSHVAHSVEERTFFEGSRPPKYALGRRGQRDFRSALFPESRPHRSAIIIRYESYHIDEDRPREIVGVVGDVKHFGLGEKGSSRRVRLLSPAAPNLSRWLGHVLPRPEHIRTGHARFQLAKGFRCEYQESRGEDRSG